MGGRCPHDAYSVRTQGEFKRELGVSESAKIISDTPLSTTARPYLLFALLKIYS